jgi:ATP-binding protein involved in chromosome partitioning
MAPTALGRKNDALVIWWNDGNCSEYDVRELRLCCPCASCVNEWTGEKILRPERVPRNVHPLRLHSVGRYAMGIQWSDGHSTGIYSYDYLRSLSPPSRNPDRPPSG